MALIDHPGVSPAYAPREAPPDERAARRTLRGQIARLERELADAVVAAFPHLCVAGEPAAQPGPRLLSLGELEAVRDDLAESVRRARVVVAERGEREAAARALLERMLVEPERHRWVRLPASELGERGCGAYHVRPRLGLVGMLMGWWQVKLSSGCPLATGASLDAPGCDLRAVRAKHCPAGASLPGVPMSAPASAYHPRDGPP